jgi:hypothetical protein
MRAASSPDNGSESAPGPPSLGTGGRLISGPASLRTRGAPAGFVSPQCRCYADVDRKVMAPPWEGTVQVRPGQIVKFGLTGQVRRVLRRERRGWLCDDGWVRSARRFVPASGEEVRPWSSLTR